MVGGKLFLTGACKLKKKKFLIWKLVATCLKQVGAYSDNCALVSNRQALVFVSWQLTGDIVPSAMVFLHNSFVWLWKFNLFFIITPRTLCSLTLFFTRFYFLYFFQDLENGISLYSASCNFGKSIESMYGNLYINYS